MKSSVVPDYDVVSQKGQVVFCKTRKRTDRELKKYFWNVTVSKGESQSGVRKLKRIACVS